MRRAEIVAETRHAGKGSRSQVSGYVWKLIRESAGMTQFQLAEDLGIDVATIQGWESGRRPLMSVRSGDLARLRVRLIRHGAPPKLFSVLHDAIEADTVIDYLLDKENKAGSPDHHPLAATVHKRDLTNLITWPLNGVLPTQLRGIVRAGLKRRGPTPSHPTLKAEERRGLFDQLRLLVETHPEGREDLLRRQAIYLLSFDGDGETTDWLLKEYAQCAATAQSSDDATRWVAVRSAAVALTRHGHKDPLKAFIASNLRDHRQETANLTYWAYWLGEVTEIHTDDAFMHTVPPSSWVGAQLLGHLVNRVASDADQLELNVRTLWQLVLARPHLLTEVPELRDQMAIQVEQTLGCRDLEKQARQELSDVMYAIRLARR